MANVTVRLDGLKGVMDTLRQLPPELVSAKGGPVRDALRRAAVVIQKQAQANVRAIVLEPNKGGLPTASTGALEKAIKPRRLKGVGGGRNGEAFSVGPGRKLSKFYAWFLEFGTEKMRAHPFMRPAYEAKKDQALATFVSEMPKAIARALKKLQAKNRVKV